VSQRKKKELNKEYSILRKLRQEKKITDEFEVMLGSLSLEDLISLKLEISSRLFRGKVVGIPIWKSLPYILRESMLRHALSITSTKTDAARFLGLTIAEINKMMYKYIPDS
tara:strand:- start:237 stop:569 length:333 start_codon:yes stop_codon:yes gene_type:complete